MASSLVACNIKLPSKKKQLLSFSTLGCPDWNFNQIINFAVKHNYDGIEVRGLQRQLDVTKAKEFNTPESRSVTLSLMKEKGLQLVALGSSANLHFTGAERVKNMDEARRYIDLAQQLNCPYVRVFPNNFPVNQEKEATIDLISSGLIQLSQHASGSNVSVLMETHGDVVHSTDILNIMQATNSKHSGLVWDIANMWTATKEPVQDVYNKLKKYIRHTHIKDAKLINGKINYTLLGEGEVPVFEAMKLIAKNNFGGYYSFEWEKLWHPDLLEPEVALADYPVKMKRFFK